MHEAMTKTTGRVETASKQTFSGSGWGRGMQITGRTEFELQHFSGGTRNTNKNEIITSNMRL